MRLGIKPKSHFWRTCVQDFFNFLLRWIKPKGTISSLSVSMVIKCKCLLCIVSSFSYFTFLLETTVSTIEEEQTKHRNEVTSFPVWEEIIVFVNIYKYKVQPQPQISWAVGRGEYFNMYSINPMILTVWHLGSWSACTERCK